VPAGSNHRCLPSRASTLGRRGLRARARSPGYLLSAMARVVATLAPRAGVNEASAVSLIFFAVRSSFLPAAVNFTVSLPVPALDSVGFPMATNVLICGADTRTASPYQLPAA